MSNTINAVLVRLSISMFNNTRQDEKITDEVKLAKSLGKGAGRWVRYKLPIEALSLIQQFAGAVRTEHYQLTLPWEEGYRLLTVAGQPRYKTATDESRIEFSKIVDEFGAQYPQWIEQAQIMHSPTFNPDDYPAWDKARQCFGLSVEYSPVPTASGFVSSLVKGEVDTMRADLEARNTQRVQAAVADTWQRVIAPVQAMAEKLASPDAVFRDSLVDNIRDMVALIPALNLTGDAALRDAANVIQQQFARLNPDTLRENKVQRREVAQQAAALVARFGNLGGRKLAA